MKFEKYQGIGNDFIILEKDITKEEVRLLCDRHYGIGADGIIVNSKKNGLPYMHFYNQDGSIATMCGNGIRCYASYLESKGEDFSKIDTLSGIKHIKKVGDKFRVDMGEPTVDFTDKPLLENINFDAVFTGCHHLLIYDDEKKYGKDFLNENSHELEEDNKLFPNGTNVNLVRVKDRKNIEIMTHERGVGITLACGTGASASAYMSYKKGLVDNIVNVKLLGGELEIEISEDNKIYMTGPAKFVYKGEI
ncbi:diaminopimelate epimerase [Oceanivirga miroungae]|uniref:Diaminopimelate epimerase n=1 Tax=Oceanivirga miroungae TaxID=1130046 RepID=A0A6I8M7Z9_9FUSO|nr:diaminopimelate epimerase [Oceanivirga miroungae]VWL85549.1 diaminopimelate epimerase [Oceanivirga miroungae]